MSNAKTVSWLSAAMMAASLSPVRADDFYRGKTVEVLVGFSPGGGYDAYGRALASVIGALQRCGVGGGVGVYVDTDSKNSSRSIR